MDDILAYKVYVKTTENGIITAINSSAFLHDTSSWTEIDEGFGDEYYHAQNYYLDRPISDNDGIYNYKLVGGKPELRSDLDKAPERTKLEAEQEIADLKRQLAKTDYISIKIAEGVASQQEYENQLMKRAEWRARINELEGLI